MAEGILKQTAEVSGFVKTITRKTEENLATIQEKVKSLMSTVESKLHLMCPGSGTSHKKKFKEHVQHHSYFHMKELQKQANIIQDTLCQLQNIDSTQANIDIPEYEV